jgi:hypothetical protein
LSDRDGKDGRRLTFGEAAVAGPHISRDGKYIIYGFLRNDGGELRYRVVHRVNRWKSDEKPKLLRVTTQGNLPLILW